MAKQDNVRQFGSKNNPRNYYVIGLPWKKNENTGNYSCSWGYLSKYDKDFYFILKKSNGQVISAAFVPRGVVMKAAYKVFKHYKKVVTDPQDPQKTITIEKAFPIALIPKKIVHNWMNMEQYKDYKFL